ncbi:hypothetical protein GJ744_009163 [Endocarpon pusillum]|uniref:Uncharacterized protein n=1 Tax=Endocarpon pusillum TaxID=364733 RepID=A0A8H7E2Z3_9EURO|nr:hypothetical protein GJ744_009163 [Endocarpon pusillum]
MERKPGIKRKMFLFTCFTIFPKNRRATRLADSSSASHIVPTTCGNLMICIVLVRLMTSSRISSDRFSAVKQADR